jgi:hypothetical protein
VRAAFKRRQKGAAIVEFALVSVLFFTMLVSVLDFSYLFWVNLTMQHAVREGARLAITGQTIAPAADCQGTVIAQMTNQSMGLWTKVNATPSFSNLCAPGQMMVITVHCTVTPFTPLIQQFFPGGVYTFDVGTTMRNEG